jgi:hypothetical protein
MFVIPIYIIIYIIEQYYNFWLGRSSYDERQIDILKKNADERISPRIRQTLLHWGFDSSKMKVQKNK